MAYSSSVLTAIAVFSGLAFSCLGIAYRLAAARGLKPCHIAVALGVAGTAFFGARAAWGVWHGQGELSRFALVIGLASGLGQGFSISMIQPASARGPFAPVWCALNLFFIPVAGYAVLAMGERLTGLQVAGLGAGVGCVIVSAYAVERPGGEGAARRAGWRIRVGYAAMLAAMVLGTSLASLAMKLLGARTLPGGASALDACGDQFLATLYLGLGAWAGVESAARRAWPAPAGALLAAGGLGAAGSLAGMYLVKISSVLPGGMGFVISCVVSLLAGAVVSSVAFGERRNAAWYLSVGLAALSVILFHAGSRMA